MDTQWDNLSDPIFHYARITPDSPAIIDGAEVVSFAEFARLLGVTALHLRGLGIGADDSVGVALTNSVDHLLISFALMRIGASPVEISPDASGEQLGQLSATLALKMVFAESTAPAMSCLVKIDPLWRDRLPQGGDFRSDRDGDSNRTLVLTSGSTGQPKAVALSHRQRMERSRRYAFLYRDRWSPATPGRFLLSAPLGFGGFLSFLHTQTLMGGPILLVPIYANIVELARAIRLHDDVVTLVTPNMCRAFLDSAAGGGPLFPRMRLLISGGLPLYGFEKQTIVEKVTPHFVELYGAVGVGPISALRAGDMVRKADSVGQPVPEMSVEIVDSDGKAVPIGTIGRVRCRYPEAAAESAGGGAGLARGEGFSEGWYYPGDLARFDQDGFLFLKGRISDVIHRNGIEILPAEIEEAIAALPEVAEVIVVGRPAPDGNGEEAVAFIVPRGDEIPAQILDAHCIVSLPVEKRPARIFIARNIPRTANGKIDRAAVKAVAARHLQ